MRKILQFFLNNSLLWVLPALVLIHTILFTYYLQQHSDLHKHQLQKQAKQAFELLIRQAAQTMPFTQLQQSMQAINDYSLKIGDEHIKFINPQVVAVKPDTSATIEKIYLPNGNIVLVQFVSEDSSLHFLLLTFLIEFSILSFYLFYVFSLQRFKSPLKNFKHSAENLGIDINANPLKLFGPQIVRDTANAMNQMQARIQTLIDRRTQMLAVISHDLRNPITRLRLRAQLFDAGEQGKKFIDDLTEMEQMINDILAFSGEDGLREKKTLLDAHSLIESLCEDFLDQGMHLHTHFSNQRMPLLAARLALKRAITNLLQNAFKYAEEVWVKLETSLDFIVLIIEDNGPGIPAAELTKVLAPYYRASSTATQRKTGSGLGLTIANEIIRSHGGNITLTNRDAGGLCVVVKLPLVVVD